MPLHRVLRMRSPRGRGQQLNLLGKHQGTKVGGKAFHKILVGIDRCPVGTTISIVVELPQVDQLIDHAGVGLEVANQFFVLTTFLERRVAKLGIQLRSCCKNVSGKPIQQQANHADLNHRRTVDG